MLVGVAPQVNLYFTAANVLECVIAARFLDRRSPPRRSRPLAGVADGLRLIAGAVLGVERRGGGGRGGLPGRRQPVAGRHLRLRAQPRSRPGDADPAAAGAHRPGDVGRVRLRPAQRRVAGAAEPGGRGVGLDLPAVAHRRAGRAGAAAAAVGRGPAGCAAGDDLGADGRGAGHRRHPERARRAGFDHRSAAPAVGVADAARGDLPGDPDPGAVRPGARQRAGRRRRARGGPGRGAAAGRCSAPGPGTWPPRR